MTQEEKELLLKDLCARLLYGVKIQIQNEPEFPFKVIAINDYRVVINHSSHIGYSVNVEYKPEAYNIEDVKPYLRPISSMTEEERQEYEKTCFFSNEIGDINTLESYDWFNKKMFAYRTIDGKDMFELGLAHEAPEGMYNQGIFLGVNQELTNSSKSEHEWDLGPCWDDGNF